MPEKLSISIPTYNRAPLLKELLESIKVQTQKYSDSANHIKVYVFSNNSTDETEEVVLNAGLNIEYQKNATNIGGDLNIHQAYIIPQGEYVWVIGDDELIPDGTINYILSIMKKFSPGLIINRPNDYNPLTEVPEFFENYRQFALFAEHANPHLLIMHSLISAMIIKKKSFDAEFASGKVYGTCYGHLYGIINGIVNSGEPVIFCRQITLEIRKIRAPLATFDPTKGVIRNIFKYVREQQVIYLEWLKETLALKELRPAKVWRAYYLRLFFHESSHSPVKAISWMVNMTLFYIRSYLRLPPKR